MIQPGDIIFVKGTGLISRLVRFFDGRGEFSHVAIAISPTEILESNWNMKSKIVPMSYLEDEYVIIRLADMTQEEKGRLREAAESLEGVIYDYLQIISILFKGRLNNPRYLICSELVYLMLLRIGYEQDTMLLNSTPNELYNILRAKEYESILSLG